MIDDGNVCFAGNDYDDDYSDDDDNNDDDYNVILLVFCACAHAFGACITFVR